MTRAKSGELVVLEYKLAALWSVECRREIRRPQRAAGEGQCAILNLVNRASLLADVLRRGTISDHANELLRRGVFMQRESSLRPIVSVTAVELQRLPGEGYGSGAFVAGRYVVSMPGPFKRGRGGLCRRRGLGCCSFRILVRKESSIPMQTGLQRRS